MENQGKGIGESGARACRGTMSRKPEDTVGQAEQELEIRYSEKFLREQRRERRKSSLVTGIFLPFVVAPLIVWATLEAYRTHTWMRWGGGTSQDGVELPPLVGAVAAALCFLYGVYCLWDYFHSRE